METVLGKKYRDTISGYEGIATAKCEYLDDSPQTLLTPANVKRDGSFVKSQWFNNARLAPIES